MKKFFITCILLFSTAYGSFLYPIENGIQKYNSSNYIEAKNYFINYISSNPNDPNGYFWLAKIYNALGDKENAKKNFKLSYEILSEQKNISKINLDPESGNIEDYFDMALAYFEEGNFKDADFYADLMLRIDASSKSAYFIKAKIAYIQQDRDKATEYLSKAILIDNNLLNTNLAKSLDITRIPTATKEFYNNQALQALFVGDIDTAIRNYKLYLKINPKDIDAHNILADLYIKNNDIEKAQIIVSKALKLNSNNVAAYINQSKIYKINNDNKKYVENLLKAHKINPNNKEALLLLGDYYLLEKDYNNSTKYFELLTNIDDNFYEAYFGYIYSLIQQKNTDKASSLIRKFVSFDQNNGEDLFLLAQICIQLQQYDDAKDYLIQALKKQENPHYRIQLSKIEKYTGKKINGKI